MSEENKPPRTPIINPPTLEYLVKWGIDPPVSGGVIVKTATEAVAVLEGRSSPGYKKEGDKSYGGLKVCLRISRDLTREEVELIRTGKLEVVLGLRTPKLQQELPLRTEDEQ